MVYPMYFKSICQDRLVQKNKIPMIESLAIDSLDNQFCILKTLSQRSCGNMAILMLFCDVTYYFIPNHNYWRDLHQLFSCLFETFGSMSEIMFSSDSMS